MLHTPESSKCTSEKRNILIETPSVAFWGSLKGIIKRKSWTIFFCILNQRSLSMQVTYLNNFLFKRKLLIKIFFSSSRKTRERKVYYFIAPGHFERNASHVKRTGGSWQCVGFLYTILGSGGRETADFPGHMSCIWIIFKTRHSRKHLPFQPLKGVMTLNLKHLGFSQAFWVCIRVMKWLLYNTITAQELRLKKDFVQDFLKIRMDKEPFLVFSGASKYFVFSCRRKCHQVWNYTQSPRKNHSIEELKQPFHAH